jgi:PAS domain S-box-containing protein
VEYNRALIRIRTIIKKILRRWFIAVIIFIVFALVITAFAFFTFNTYRDLDNYVTSQKRSLSSLSAAIIREKLDKIIAVGSAHVSGENFRELVESGEWDKALNLDPHILKEMPYIEAINLFSSDGIFKSTIPYDVKLASYYGTNFSTRDYFKAVSESREPYAGELIVPIVSIDHTLILVLIPIKTDSDKIIGFMVLNLSTEVVTSWINEVDSDINGYVYVVDVKGNLISHPSLSKKRELVSFSALSPVQKALRGESGVEVGYNSIEKVEQLSSYSPVKGYGWGVVVAQSAESAFLGRNNTIASIVIIEAIIVVVLGAGAYILLRDRYVFKNQRDREESLLNSIGDSVIAIDRNWNVTLWNNSAVDLTGYSKDEAINKPLFSLIKLLREMDRGENIQFIEDMMVTGKPNDLDYPAILVSKEGGDVAVNNSVAPIFDEDQDVIGVVIVMRDISRKRQDSMLHSDFAYASHQLRTPVTEAIWSLEAVLGENDTEKIKKNAKIAHSSMQSVKKLSEELITVSEIDQGEVSLDITDVNLQNLFDEVREAIGKKAEEHAIKIQFPKVVISETVNTSQKLLTRILIEIIDNAIVYSDTNSKIVIEINQNDTFAEFKIQDFGIGIDLEHQPLVFTKFFRGSNFAASDIAGAGLGLYIAKGYAKLLNGKIWFKSEKDRSTTFYVSIPLIEKPRSTEL